MAPKEDNRHKSKMIIFLGRQIIINIFIILKSWNCQNGNADEEAGTGKWIIERIRKTSESWEKEKKEEI